MAKRARCSHCLKASSACICQQIVSIDNKYSLHILQDPSEEKKAIGTARILKLSLSKVQLCVGSVFNEQNFDLNNCYLLFPAEDATPAIQCQQTFSLNEQSQFIVLDGSWKKAFKLLMLNPFLQKLPKICITDAHKSNYRLRKSAREDGLSTVEAGYYLLSQLENNSEKFLPLLQTFEYMIDYQISKIPEDIYLQHYVKTPKDKIDAT